MANLENVLDFSVTLNNLKYLKKKK